MSEDYLAKALRKKKVQNIGVVRQLGGDPVFNKPSFKLIGLDKNNKPLMPKKPKRAGSQYYRRVMRKLRKEM